MNLNIDSVIFISFLVVTIIAGFASSHGIKNIKEYAIGNRNFSTATITATIVATWVSGESFFSYLSDSFSQGLYAIWAYMLGEISYFFIVGYFFAPRLAEFIGKLSIAEAMGDLYGRHVRIITAITGCTGIIGLIAMQLMVAGLLFEYCFNIQGYYGIIIAGVIITIYSSLGGIKSVTFTDVIQFITFSTIMPIIVYFIFSTLDIADIFINTINDNPMFDYHQVFDFTQPKSLYYLSIALVVATSGFGPPMFQRIAMARDTIQISKSYIIAGFTCILLALMMSWIGILVLSSQPDIEPSDVVKHVLFNYSHIGLKGLTLAGIMAMVMSTADSYVNSTSILIVHDFCKPLGLKFIKDELFFSRVVSLLIGFFAIFIALYSSGNLMQILIASNTYYIPIVTVPFILAVLGFRSSSKSVLIGMSASFIIIVACQLFVKNQFLMPIIPGIVANLIFLIGSHYFLKQPGGWVGIKDNTALNQVKYERKIKIRNFRRALVNFNLLSFFRRNGLHSEAGYVCFGLFCIISAFSTIHTLPKEVQVHYQGMINFIYPSVLFMSTVLISYPLWLVNWKDKNIISIFWNIAVFYILICGGFLLVIMSNFAHFQLMAFMVNLIVIAVLIRWQWALFMMIIGLFITLKLFKLYLGVDSLPENFIATEFEATYLLLLVSSILIIFLKPKQEQYKLTEERNEHLSDRIGSQKEEMLEAQALRSEFIRNVSHEYHAPMAGIVSTAEGLKYAYDQLTDDQRKFYIDAIFQSSHSLKAFDDNIVTLARLSKSNYQLKKEGVDFSNLVYGRAEVCRKLYGDNSDDQEFIFDIASNITASIDKKYMIQLLDNLIINAITFCKQGKIKISLRMDNQAINLEIADEGIGIPKHELYDVFEPFTVSSKTRTPAGGRGVGLTVCKKIMEAHGGSIGADSDGIKGTTFKIVLPV